MTYEHGTCHQPNDTRHDRELENKATYSNFSKKPKCPPMLCRPWSRPSWTRLFHSGRHRQWRGGRLLKQTMSRDKAGSVTTEISCNQQRGRKQGDIVQANATSFTLTPLPAIKGIPVSVTALAIQDFLQCAATAKQHASFVRKHTCIMHGRGPTATQ